MLVTIGDKDVIYILQSIEGTEEQFVRHFLGTSPKISLNCVPRLKTLPVQHGYIPLCPHPVGQICSPIIDVSPPLHLNFMELICYHYQPLPPVPSKLPMHPYSFLVSTTQKHTPHPEIPMKKKCFSFLPPCPPHKKQYMITLYPRHNLLLLLCQIYFHLEDHAQL